MIHRALTRQTIIIPLKRIGTKDTRIESARKNGSTDLDTSVQQHRAVRWSIQRRGKGTMHEGHRAWFRLSSITRLPFRAMALVPGNSLHLPPRIIPSGKFLSRRHAYAQPLFSMIPRSLLLCLRAPPHLSRIIHKYSKRIFRFSSFLLVQKRNIFYK